MSTVSLATQLLTVSIISLQRQIYHNRALNRTSWYDSYDFVVIGGGTAGSVVATRLSENPNVNVLLVENGPPVLVDTDSVANFRTFQHLYEFYTTPQENSGFAFANREVEMFRGNILGGSGSINAALYTRGNRRDFDSWSNYYGAQGWTYEEVLPYFIKSENNTDPNVVAANPGYHGTEGPMQISTIENPDPLLDLWVDANIANGYPLTDINGPNQFGTRVMQIFQFLGNRTRVSGATAYLEPNILRPNLHVLVNTLVTKINFAQNTDGTPTATGIEFSRNNRTYTVNASREVIVSGGAFQTPQLLMISGIGPQRHLQQHNISVIADLQVGEGLQDHPVAINYLLATNSSDIQWSGHASDGGMQSIQNYYSFLTEGKGPLAQLAFCETYYPTDINGNKDWPDTMAYMYMNEQGEIDVSTFVPKLQEEWREYFDQFTQNNNLFSILSSLFRVHSTGTVRLASTNMRDAPLLDPRYYTDQRDLFSIVKGTSMALKVAESPAFRQYFKYPAKVQPGCELCSDRPPSECYSYIACIARTLTINTFHPCCTARMGNSSNPLAVVDARLRVFGVHNLRVIDTSVMPVVINANTNAATFMIAERGSDFIRQDNGLV